MNTEVGKFLAKHQFRKKLWTHKLSGEISWQTPVQKEVMDGEA
jgi:hypothetical protein